MLLKKLILTQNTKGEYMEKKIFFVVCLFSILVMPVLANTQYQTKEQFAESLKNCTPGRYALNVSIVEQNIGTVQSIIGIRNGKCRYAQEYDVPDFGRRGIICDLNDSQRMGLYKSFTSNVLEISTENSQAVKCESYEWKGNQWLKRNEPTTMYIKNQ